MIGMTTMAAKKVDGTSTVSIEMLLPDTARPIMTDEFMKQLAAVGLTAFTSEFKNIKKVKIVKKKHIRKIRLSDESEI